MQLTTVKRELKDKKAVIRKQGVPKHLDLS